MRNAVVFEAVVFHGDPPRASEICKVVVPDGHPNVDRERARKAIAASPMYAGTNPDVQITSVTRCYIESDERLLSDNGLLDDVRIEADEDGWHLILDTDAASHNLRAPADALERLDQALRPYREWRAEGEAVRAEYEAHTRAGYCGAWAAGLGPCMKAAGHTGDHDRAAA